MKLKKLATQLENYLDEDSRVRKEHREEMKALLHKLKAKEKRLSEEALEEFNKKKLGRLRKDIEMVHAQRKKGVKALKALVDKQGSKD